MIRKTKYLILAIFVTFCSQQAEPVNQDNQTSEEVTTSQVENEESNNTCLLYTSDAADEP